LVTYNEMQMRCRQELVTSHQSVNKRPDNFKRSHLSSPVSHVAAFHHSGTMHPCVVNSLYGLLAWYDAF